jgi:hypothetical protein
LTQFLLQHCVSRRHLPPVLVRTHSFVTGIARGNLPRTDLQVLFKRNPAHSPLQQWESITHFFPTSLIVVHSFPLSSLFGSYPPNRRALASSVIARRETIIRVKVDVTFMLLVHLLCYVAARTNAFFALLVRRCVYDVLYYMSRVSWRMPPWLLGLGPFAMSVVIYG